MGIFGDMKRAQEMSADHVVPVPAQRLDTLVTDPVSGRPRRRTDYAGTVWYGGKPHFINGHPLPGRNSEIATPFWLPDSHRYAAGAVADVQIQAGGAVQGGMATSGGGGNFQILEVAAALAEGPDGSGALLVFVAVTAVATIPLGVAYRVTVICAPDAPQPPAA